MVWPFRLFIRWPASVHLPTSSPLRPQGLIPTLHKALTSLILPQLRLGFSYGFRLAPGNTYPGMGVLQLDLQLWAAS